LIKYHEDEGVAPVVAMLLILAIIVTVMSVYFNTYVPALKEEAEIEHLSGVEKEFLTFSSDLQNAVWQKAEGKLGRSFKLGGGDVFLSSIKSGGGLKVEKDSTLFGIENTTGTVYNSSLVKFSYESISNFWQNQGYSWQYGYVNLTTGYGTQTPLQYTDMDSVQENLEKSLGIFSSLFNIEYSYEPVFQPDGVGNYTGTRYLNCTELSLTIVNFQKGEKSYVSGNGIAELNLETEINKYSFNETELNFIIYNDASMNVNQTLWKNINKDLRDFENRHFSNVDDVSCYVNPDDNLGKDLDITFRDPVRVTIRQVNLTVSAKV